MRNELLTKLIIFKMKTFVITMSVLTGISHTDIHNVHLEGSLPVFVEM